MRQTHSYTATHYNRDNGFPLVWIFRCCLGRSTSGKTIHEEATQHHARHEAERQGKIIGRPGPQAFKMSSNQTRQTNKEPASSEVRAAGDEAESQSRQDLDKSPK